MDNFQIDITGEGEESLLDGIRIALRHNAPGGSICGYTITDEEGLVFLWSTDDYPLAVRLPFVLDAAGATDFAGRWLRAPNLPWPKRPDIDGSCGKGWRLYTQRWGHVGPYSYAVVAFQPVWKMVGK